MSTSSNCFLFFFFFLNINRKNAVIYLLQLLKITIKLDWRWIKKKLFVYKINDSANDVSLTMESQFMLMMIDGINEHRLLLLNRFICLVFFFTFGSFLRFYLFRIDINNWQKCNMTDFEAGTMFTKNNKKKTPFENILVQRIGV